MKESLQFSGKMKFGATPGETDTEAISGEFCPLPQAKSGGLLGGATTSAFMSAFL